ncbi:hypothetical protein [Streptomyces sp. JJ36]|uniref:hypothetical protein n=1 Tax=Streptomyces sp. JJ36 TaxID=2736645 RepID=UPI001F221A4D|nr:hypothetical protein [Streptomyces sp. JJ36]MCF6521574.1 hypothetical protein [Streptomyces sp. JJ36]
MTAPRRVKVTSPQTRIALARRHRVRPRPLPLPGPSDPERARRVFAAQRRTALRTMGLLALVLLGTSGVIGALPVLDRVTAGGVPVSWLVLAIATYPLLLVIAVAHVRAAERTEAAEGGGDGPGEEDAAAEQRAGGPWAFPGAPAGAVPGRERMPGVAARTGRAAVSRAPLRARLSSRARAAGRAPGRLRAAVPVRGRLRGGAR